MFAFSLAHLKAICLPIPRDAPVMKIVLPAKDLAKEESPFTDRILIESLTALSLTDVEWNKDELIWREKVLTIRRIDQEIVDSMSSLPEW